MTNALIIIDVQHEYTTGRLPISHPPVDDALANIATAIDAAAARGAKVVVVQHDAPEGAPIFAPGTETWQNHEVVADRPHDHLVHKTKASSFADTDLGEWLDANGVTTVTLAGFMTQNCVVATAFDADARGLAVEILSDATGAIGLSNAAGTVDARTVHETLMTVFASNIATVGTTAEWAKGEALTGSNLVESVRA
ncbi:isochorismatase family protein [Phytomonospora endophytica]|uniref:Nicotinamidase-related amidase n=1 Tax=Phytomonospora endophytica TaxID=714109 RepID=A0A841G3W1_9ACTN|nr:isochorismatase family protein [Phytomonospora endophytica]MBB6039399.1 nicotinamidase-related amidase [Phytomonospora endophytica]GIG70126.1 isochorismatase [Phytomonospora endophytica]